MASLRVATKLSLESASKDENGSGLQPGLHNNSTKRSAAEVDATTTKNLKALSLLVVESMAADEHRHVNKRTRTGESAMGFSKKRALSAGEKTGNTTKKSKASAPSYQVRSRESEGNRYTAYRQPVRGSHFLASPHTARFLTSRHGDS